MSISSNRLIPPITSEEINQLFGTSFTDAEDLVLYSGIKMWAKYKPVRWGSGNPDAAKNSDGTWNPDTAVANQWWRATDGNYGLDFSGAQVTIQNNYGNSHNVKVALEELVTKYTGGANGWSYIRPLGTGASPFRIDDLIQYNHGVKNPIYSMSTWNIVARENEQFNAGLSYIETPNDPINTRDYLRPDDVAGGLYRGVAIFKLESGSYSCIAWATGTTWTGTGVKPSSQANQYQDGYSYATTLLVNGATYYILPFYSNVEMAQGAAGQSKAITTPGYKLIAVPYVSMLSFTCTQANRTMVLSNRTITAVGRYTADMSLNNTGVAFTAAYRTAIVNELFNGTFATGNYRDGTYEDGTMTFGNGTTLIKSFSTTNLGSDHTWRVYLQVDGEEFYQTLIQTAPV